MSLTTNLVAYWKLDGNSTAAFGGINGTDNAITYSNPNGIINNGAGFNGTSSNINLGSSSSLNLQNAAFSVSFWNKPASTSGPQGMVSRRESNGGGNPNRGWAILYSNTAQKYTLFQVTSGGSQTVTNTTTVGTGTFAFLTVTIDGSGNVAWYRNGVADGTGTIVLGTGDAGVNAYIGQGQDDPATFLCNGAIDEVGIWSRALTSGEVSQLYNGGAGIQYPFGVTNSSGFFLATR